MAENPEIAYFDIVDASIDDHRNALATGQITSVRLVISYLNRIATYDNRGGLNAFTIINPTVLVEASESDTRRAAGLTPRPLEGIPYTLKDSFKYRGLTVANGSPAFDGLLANADSCIAAKLRAAGAVLIGKTNMPPMAAGGMQRGLYGRAESPYNTKYLTAAFSSGSSNGAATSTTASMSVFGLGSETVSSGRSPASNNALCAYTPSRGVLSCRGLWPLYVTCDVPVPYTRSMRDLLDVLSVIAEPDEEEQGDFWREQTHVEMPRRQKIDFLSLAEPNALRGKRIGVPKMYVGKEDSDPHAKYVHVSPEVIHLWEAASTDLQALGAEIVHTDFPLVTNYENDSRSHEANNVVGAPPGWNQVERGLLIAKAWDRFLVQNLDNKLPKLEDVCPELIFPKPEVYVPDAFFETRNFIDYANLVRLASKNQSTSIYDLPGMEQALKSLEAQRKRDLEDWMDRIGLDCLAFPANGDVGLADLEFNMDSARQSLQNGVKYSHGNRAIRHLGVPTVSVPMGVMENKAMPVNLTFAGRAYDDDKLLSFAYAYERGSSRRISPPLTPALSTDKILRLSKLESNTNFKLTARAELASVKEDMMFIRVESLLEGREQASKSIEVYLDGVRAWSGPVEGRQSSIVVSCTQNSCVGLGWDLKPLQLKPTMVLVVAHADIDGIAASLLWVSTTEWALDSVDSI